MCALTGLEDTIWSSWPWPRSLQVLENALSSARGQHYLLTCWKWAKIMTNFVYSRRTPESLQKNFWRQFFSLRMLEISGKFTKFRSEDLLFIYLFFWRTPKISFFFSFFLNHFRVVPLVLGLEHSCTWPREGLSSVGLSLTSDFFLCPSSWPRALCPWFHLWVLDH